MRTVLPSPVRVDSWGGLNLAIDPADVGLNEAVDGLNFQLGRAGEIGARQGFRQYNSTSNGGTVWLWVDWYPSAPGGASGANGAHICITKQGPGVGNTVTFKLQTGGYSNTFVLANCIVTSGVMFGTATTRVFYYTVTDGTGQALRAYTGTAEAATTTAGKPLYVAIAPTSNRLVQGGYFAAADTPSGANGTRSTVFFSDPDAPETYTSTNWVQLTAGDGEVITGIESFNDTVYVFKQTKVFVFYGEGTNATGGAEFFYRRVDLPSPIPASTVAGTTLSGPRLITSGRDGIYFVTLAGIYRLGTGDRIDRVSAAIDPGVFTTDTRMALRISDMMAPTQNPWLSYAGDYLFFRYESITSGVARTLVYSPDRNVWMLWDRPHMTATNPRTGWIIAAITPTGNTSANLFYSQASVTADDASYGDANPTPPASSFKSGWSDLGAGDAQKRLRGAKVWGTGVVTYGLREDYATSDPLSRDAALTLGTSPTVARAIHRAGYRARRFSISLSGTAAWTISNLSLNDYA